MHFRQRRDLFGHLLPMASVLGVSIGLSMPGCSATVTSNGPPSGDGGGTINPPVDDGGGSPDDTGVPEPGDSGGSLLGFTPSNIDVSVLDTSAVGDVQITADQTIETDLGGLLNTSGAYTYQEMALPSGKLGVFVVNSLTIAAGVTARALGADALVIVALDTITIQGTLLGDSNDPNKGPGAVDQSVTANTVGGGAGGGGAGSATTSGGGGGYCGTGGTGASLVGASDDATGGPAFGSPSLVPLLPGSNGGTGGVGSGGVGGGAIQLVAANGITITGVIGVGGRGGGASGAYQMGFAGSQQAAGAGSGGAILLEAPTVDVSGTLAANGGGGGGTEDGSAGTADANPAAGGPGDATHAAGGDGSAAANIDGLPGTTVPDGASGGGGGGAGRIRINTTTGSATLGGIVSPAMTTACVTQGTLD